MPCVYFNICCQCMSFDHKLHNPESSSVKCKCQKEKRMKPLHCFVKIINKVDFFNCFLCYSDCLNRIAYNVAATDESRVEPTWLHSDE